MGYEDCDKSTRGVESERVYVKVIKFVRLWEFFRSGGIYCLVVVCENTRWENVITL